MKRDVQIIPYDSITHQDAVINLWADVFGYETAHNEPRLVLQKKEAVDDGLFFVSLSRTGKVTGTVMCGYDGHRGWIYSLAVSPKLQRSGIGSALMNHAEKTLEELGCMKINLQIVENNKKVQAFYETLGFSTEKRISMGKHILSNISKPLKGKD
ncbi:MAG: GNAT family acetyltransferase [Verrucomicrobiota bacterium]